MNRILWNLVSVVISGALILGLAGCSDDDNPAAPAEPGNAQVRLVHASPDAPMVDAYVGAAASPAVSALGYGMASAYLTVPAGTYTIDLRAHGADPTSTPAFSVTVTLAEGQKVTAVAAGLLGSSSAEDGFRVLPLVEEFAAPGAGNAAVRIVHAAPDAPSVALDIANDGVPEVTGFERFAETGAAGVALPAGTPLRVGVWAGDPLARVAVFTTPSLPAGAGLFLIATGLLGGDVDGDGFSLLAIGPEAAVGFVRQDAPATIYALHASPDAPAVAVDADGAPVIASLGFGDLAGPLAVLPGSYGLDFRAVGSSVVAASATTPYLEPGVEYLVIATGYLGGAMPGFQVLPLASGFDGASADALVRLVHASPDAPAVDVGPLVGGDVAALADYTGIAFGEASTAAGTALPVGALTVGVAASGSVDPVASFDVTTAAGLRAFAVACGSLGDTGESFRLVLVIAGEADWTAVTVLPFP